MDIIAPCISSMYDTDKKNNSILKIPWFYTQASHFPRIGHDTMGEITEKNWRKWTHSAFLVVVLFKSLTWHTDQTQHQGNCQ